MAIYSFNAQGIIEIDFKGVKPDEITRKKMKSVKFQWKPSKMIWWAYKSEEAIAVAKEICKGGISDQTSTVVVQAAKNGRKTLTKDYALKIKIKDVVNADKIQIETWVRILKDYVNDVMSEDNFDHSKNTVSKSQELAWINCFKFIAKHLSGLSASDQEYELIFEYSLPGTVHKRPDVLLLTNKKVLSLEFKKKEAPQIDSNKDDVTQAIRYKEWIQNHHKETRDRGLEVKSYLVCTHKNAASGELRGIKILTDDNFCNFITTELRGEFLCSFETEWLKSSKTEMPDMLRAIEIMYCEKRIPYISDVNKNCLTKVLRYINKAKEKSKKLLILINGVPGAGKTAVGQSIIYEKNKNGKANAVYLSGNAPLIEVLQYQINKIGNNEHMGENIIQGIKEFKTTFFENEKIPDQSILIFDEAQRAWDAKKHGKGFSEPEGLFRVCEKIYKKREYVVLIALYGNGQAIYKGEEAGLILWENALKEHEDWIVIAGEDLAGNLQGMGKRLIVDNDMFLPVSLRADFIDYSKWVEQAICRTHTTAKQAKKELEILQKTSMQIYVTRDFAKVKKRVEEIKANHPKWKYGMLLSNFAEQGVINKAIPGWNIKYKGRNTVLSGKYGSWFDDSCKELNKVCSVYGNQGLELDCPIVVFDGSYVRQDGKWMARGSKYDSDIRQGNYEDPDIIVENNYRVLLTRARKEMMILIPDDFVLNETYQYFVDMGMDVL